QRSSTQLTSLLINNAGALGGDGDGLGGGAVRGLVGRGRGAIGWSGGQRPGRGKHVRGGVGRNGASDIDIGQPQCIRAAGDVESVRSERTGDSVESIYEEMWAADVAAMSGYYSGVSAVAAQVVPWQSVLKGLPGLASGLAGGAGAGSGFAGGSGMVGGAAGSPGSQGGAGAGSDTAGANAGGDASSSVVAGGGAGGAGLVGAGGYASGGGGADSGAMGAPGGAVDGASSGVGGGGGGMAASAGAATPGMGAMAMPIAGMAAARAVMAAGGGQSGPVNAGPPVRETAPAAPEPEAAAPAPGEVEAPVPQMAVLPTADPGIAAAAAPGSKPQATRATGTTGIPASPLRSSPAGTESKRSAPTQDQQDGAEQTAAEDTVVPLRPEAVAGELRSRVQEPSGIQMRGG
ncbi:PPE family protein, partial [Mycobacterium ulcerans]